MGLIKEIKYNILTTMEEDDSIIHIVVLLTVVLKDGKVLYNVEAELEEDTESNTYFFLFQFPDEVIDAYDPEELEAISNDLDELVLNSVFDDLYLELHDIFIDLGHRVYDEKVIDFEKVTV